MKVILRLAPTGINKAQLARLHVHYGGDLRLIERSIYVGAATQLMMEINKHKIEVIIIDQAMPELVIAELLDFKASHGQPMIVLRSTFKIVRRDDGSKKTVFAGFDQIIGYTLETQALLVPEKIRRIG